MRLVCPNCGAQYEVPDEVVPLDGRDVQCSNCGHTWFQQHPDDDRDLASDLGQALRDEEWSPPEPEAEAEPEPEFSDDAEPEFEDDGEAWDTETPEAEPEPERTVAAAATPRRRRLDPNVADVLREEAEAETRKRSAEAGGLESQPDLGLQEPEELDEREKRARQARDRMARMRGEPVGPEATAVAAAGASRRDLLPDIDEINSTLRSSSERRASAVEDAEMESDIAAETQSRGGFRRGFVIAILLFVIAAAVYVYAPTISDNVPQARGPLDAYVARVDNMRATLNGYIASGLTWLDSMSSNAGG